MRTASLAGARRRRRWRLAARQLPACLRQRFVVADWLARLAGRRLRGGVAGFRVVDGGLQRGFDVADFLAAPHGHALVLAGLQRGIGGGEGLAGCVGVVAGFASASFSAFSSTSKPASKAARSS
jgi:hypothetical protein